jgi:myo-inositol 2-dehydrogenase / D-chiro-inositol 1-dehydrogenase
MSMIRYGVIGTGMMGVEHIENILATEQAVVTALADPETSSLDRALASCGDGAPPLVFTDHRALLDADVCDAVVVATPNMTHRSVLTDVLAAPVHLLVEKPLCITTAECREVKGLAAERDHLVWVGLEYRYMPTVTALVDEVRAGQVGTVHMIAIREHRFPFLRKVDDWNRFATNTGGTLVEKCCHFFDLMNLVVEGARPVRVFASGAQSVNHLDEVYDGRPADMLDNAYVIVEYDSGARGMLDLCMFAEATQNQEEISVVGDLGKVEALIPDDELRVGRRGEHWIGGVERRHIVDESVAHQGLHHGSSFIEHQHFIEAILSGGQPEVTVDDGLLSVAIGEAAHRSIATGGPVLMSDLVG